MTSTRNAPKTLLFYPLLALSHEPASARDENCSLFFILILVTSISPLLALASESGSGLAVVSRGAGACVPCVTGEVKAAKSNGLSVILVDGGLSDFSVLTTAKVWI